MLIIKRNLGKTTDHIFFVLQNVLKNFLEKREGQYHKNMESEV